MLKIILAEGHTIVRNGIRLLLETDSAIHIEGEANNSLEVIAMLQNGRQADVVLTDMTMPELNGSSLIRDIHAVSPDCKVVILSMMDNEKFVRYAFQEGAFGYLLKNISTDELIFALRHVNSGGRYLCAELSMRIVDKQLKSTSVNLIDPHTNFSKREKEVLGLIAQGLTDNEISEKLFISKRTVEGHRQSLIAKTNTKNTATLIRLAVLSGLVS